MLFLRRHSTVGRLGRRPRSNIVKRLAMAVIYFKALWSFL